MRQWWIIVDMAEGTPKTPTDLARIGDVDKGLLSRNLKVLIGLGLVSAERSRADRRARLISLTDAGWALNNDVSPIMRARDRKLTADLSESDLGILLDALGRLEVAAANMGLSEAEPDPTAD